MAGLRGVLGAVDGTLVPILAPSIDENAFVCRKGFHALNVQAVASYDLRFTDWVCRWPGSQHDAWIFNNSALKNHLETTKPGHLLGDSGYALKEYLLTPRLREQTRGERLFNVAHARTRVVVERAFGVLKSRFRCLHRSGGTLMFTPGKCASVVEACMRLHNMCIEYKIPAPEPEGDEGNDVCDDALFDGHEDRNGHQTRQRIIQLDRMTND